jgi:hypothetical protein
MHFAEDGITIANPVLTEYQAQEIQWRRQERRTFLLVCAAGFLFGVGLWLAAIL